MNAQEQVLISQLLQNLQVAASQLAPSAVDPEAAALISRAFTQTPSLAYLLTQRHLLLEHALQNAQVHIQTLERERAQAQSAAQPAAASFLGDASSGWGNAAPAAELNAYGQPIGRVAPAHMGTNAMPNDAATNSAAMNAAPAASRAGSSFGGGSFLGSAAAAATGVVGGALLFQGIEHLMGGGNSGLMGGSGLAGNTAPVEDITNVTENVYNNAPNPDLSATDTNTGWDNAAFNDPSADPMNDPSNTTGTFDTGNSDSGGWNNDFSNTADNSSLFDSSGDDNSGGFFGGLFGGGDGGDDDWV